MSPGLEEALAHVRRGWSTLPLIPQGKKPALALLRATRGRKAWKSLQSKAAGEDEVRAWFELEPETNIGVVCGEVSGNLVNVDRDHPELLPPGFAAPATATVATPRGPGAMHGYYRSERPVETKEFAWGEVRGEGAYSVAPSSRFKGPEYEGSYLWQATPETVGLTDFAAVTIPDFEAQRPAVATPYTPPRSSSRDNVARLGTARFDYDAAAVVKMCAALGISSPFYGNFDCVIHRPDDRSASIWRGPDGIYLYRDWHASRYSTGKAWLNLAQVRAAVAGRPGARGYELKVWKLRLLVEAGLLQPFETEDLGVGLGLWSSILYLVACRWAWEDAGAPLPLERRFLAAWSGLPERQVREEFDEIFRSGLIRQVEKRGRLRYWLPHEAALPMREGVNL